MGNEYEKDNVGFFKHFVRRLLLLIGARSIHRCLSSLAHIPVLRSEGVLMFPRGKVVVVVVVWLFLCRRYYFGGASYYMLVDAHRLVTVL